MNNKFDISETEMINPAIAPDVKTVSLDSIIDEVLVGNYDFDAPYQRGIVWKKGYSIELLKSLIDGTPIGAIHFVMKRDDPTCDERWVLDGKQRLSSIEAFVRKGSTLKLKIMDDVTKEVVQVSYKSMKNPKSKWHFIYNRIRRYQITQVTWPFCDFETQGMIFDRVNNSVALNSWEKIYGKYFIVKNLFQYIFNNYFINIKYLNKQQAEDRRNTGIQLIHSILCVNFGYEITDVFAPRNIASKNLEESCIKLEKMLRSNNVDATTEFDDALIEKLNLQTKLKCLKTASKTFERAVSYKNPLKNKFESGFVLDTITFLTKKLEEQILTTPMIEQNPAKIHEFISEWLWYKNADSTPEEKQRRQAIKSRSTQGCSISQRHAAMEKIFLDIGFDNQVKNNKISNKEKTIALLNASATCPMTGVALSDDNFELDHIIPKSVSDTTKVVVTSDVANRRKSDQTLETVKATVKFIEENTKEV